ncbi:MAG: hypothetical protein HKN15_01640 [Xanthomonadales bacterium]|nr:hypothetical protein [Xanthomonadales bacterium]
MTRLLTLTLFATVLLATHVAARAESGMYRVEVLVFNHLESDAAPVELQEIRAFLEAPDLAEVLVQPAPYPMDVMSTAMQDAWQRLRNSATFRPLLFVTWEQTRIDYHPPVRIHDDDVIAEQLHFPYQTAFLDLRSMDVGSEYLAPYYRLDGTAQLRRSRFLHLNLDLEYRADLLPRPEPVPENREDALSLQEEDAAQVLAHSPGPALVHRLSQSRQVRTGQMQYFDSPFLGVLARVTATTGE